MFTSKKQHFFRNITTRLYLKTSKSKKKSESKKATNEIIQLQFK